MGQTPNKPCKVGLKTEVWGQKKQERVNDFRQVWRAQQNTEGQGRYRIQQRREFEATEFMGRNSKEALSLRQWVIFSAHVIFLPPVRYMWPWDHRCVITDRSSQTKRYNMYPIEVRAEVWQLLVTLNVKSAQQAIYSTVYSFLPSTSQCTRQALVPARCMFTKQKRPQQIFHLKSFRQLNSSLAFIKANSVGQTLL